MASFDLIVDNLHGIGRMRAWAIFPPTPKSMKTSITLFAGLLALVSQFACVAPGPYVRRAPPPLPPPQVVYYQPAAPAPQVEVVYEQVQPPMPPPQRQLVIARPGPNFIWIDGYWSWQSRSHRYVWVGGRWERPPHQGANWAAAHWETRGGGNVFIEGTWR